MGRNSRIVGKAMSIPVRLAFTTLLLGVPFVAGMSFVSPWWILPIAFVFAMADVVGKWRLLFEGEPLAKSAQFALKALAVQPFVLWVVYLFGRGVGSFAGTPVFSSFAGGMSAGHIGIYAVVVVVAGMVLIVAERDKLSLEDVMMQTFDEASRQKRYG